MKISDLESKLTKVQISIIVGVFTGVVPQYETKATAIRALATNALEVGIVITDVRKQLLTEPHNWRKARDFFSRKLA